MIKLIDIFGMLQITNDLWRYSYLNIVNLNTNYINYLNNDDIKWVQKIEDTDWIVGERLYTDILETPIYNVYQNEIVNPNTDTFKAKIGLMYVSDYGYAASLKYWANNLFEYDNFEINDEDWMYMGLDELTILRYTDLKRAYSIDSSGKVGYTYFNNLNQSDLELDWSLVLRPVFYLISNTTYIFDVGIISEQIKIN